MAVREKDEKRHDDILIVASNKIDLEASWDTSSCRVPQSILQVFERLRNQAATTAYLAILGALKLVGVQAHHTEILSIAFASIVITAIMTEWISRK